MPVSWKSRILEALSFKGAKIRYHGNGGVGTGYSKVKDVFERAESTVV